MIKLIPTYRIVCDICKISVAPDNQSKEDLIQIAKYSGWHESGSHNYCPYCVKKDENGNLVAIKNERKDPI